MKKKTKIIILIFLMIILLTPIRMNLKDGGSVRFKALLYEVTQIHQLAPIEVEEDDGISTPYVVGWEVKILGIKIYRNTWIVEAIQ